MNDPIYNWDSVQQNQACGVINFITRCWGAEAVAALSKLAGRLSIRNNDLKSKTIFSLYSRLGLTLVRAN